MFQAKDFVNKFVLKAIVTYYDDHDLKDVVDHIQEEVLQFMHGILLQFQFIMQVLIRHAVNF